MKTMFLIELAMINGEYLHNILLGNCYFRVL